MANILSLALKINADASGLRLTPVERALQKLGEEADKITGVFSRFTSESESAVRSQQQFATDIAFLNSALKTGQVTAAQYAEEFEKLSRAAEAESAALQRAAQITEANLLPLERFAREQAELNEQLNAGRITLDTYTRAIEKSAKGLSDADRAAAGLAVQQKTIEGSAEKTTLKFNELSGVFAVLPGPLGNIAGRISGIASASEGLSRVFAGGLKAGIANIASTFTALINRLTLALAGIAALGAGAVAIVKGLQNLEDRVEKLGNTAAKLGVSFGFIQTLDEAARRSGTSIDSVSAAFGRLQKSVLGVDEESKAAQKALLEIGVTAEELQALSPEEQYQRIGTALAGIEDPARRTAAATALFGRAGSDLIPFFNNIGKATADMERFGATLSDVDRGRIDSLGDAFDGVFVSLQGLGQSVLLPFVGLVEGVAKAFSGLVNIVTAVAQAIGSVLGPVLDAIGSAFGAFGDAVNSTVGFFRSLFGSAEETATATANVAKSVTLSAEEVEALSKAIDGSNKSLDTAITKAGEFGQAGFDAAMEFQTAIQDLKDQAAEGELNADQYSRGVALATAEYEKQIEAARKVAEENKRLAEEAKRRAEAEAEAVQRIIDANLEQLRVDEQFGGDSNRAKAADNLNKLLAEQTRVEQELAAARAAGDQTAIDAATSRLATIDQVAARERDIASGAAKQREDAAKAAADAAKEAERIAEQRSKELERVNEQILTKQEEFAARQFEIELERARELATVRTGSVEINDIRSGGIGAFFDTLQEDPAIAEAKKQRAELEKIRKEIAKLNADKVDILAGTG